MTHVTTPLHRARTHPRAHAQSRAQVRQTHAFGTLQEHEFERKWAGCAPRPRPRPLTNNGRTKRAGFAG